MEELIRLLTVASPIVAIVALVMGRADHGRDGERRIQRISDNIDSIRDDVRETRADVKDMSRALTDHGERLRLLEDRQTALSERVSRIEQSKDARSVGATD